MLPSQPADSDSPIVDRHRAYCAIPLIARGFRAGLPIRTVFDSASSRYSLSALTNPHDQHKLIKGTLYFAPPSPPPSFTFGVRRCARLVRAILDVLDHTPHPRLDEHLINSMCMYLMPGPASHPAEDEDVYFVFDMPRRRRTRFDSPAPFAVTLAVSKLFSDLGHRVWEAAIVLHAHATVQTAQVAKHLEGSVVLELGAGTGISAFTYEQAEVQRVVLTDLDDTVVDNMKRNIRTNVTSSGLVVAEKLDFGDCDRVRQVAVQKHVDVVVAADVTYDPALMRMAVAAFETALRDTERVGFLFATSRNESSDAELDRELAQSAMTVGIVDDEVDLECFDYLCGWGLKGVRIFILTST